MSPRDDENRLRHMLDYSREAVALIVGKTRADLERERLLQLGIVRLVEIIGEAAARVSKPTQDAYPGVPWTQIVSTRNRLIHGYDFVDYDILWHTVQEDLPALIRELEDVLSSDDRS
ncbi:MAG: DUF86 domain-containing protein [Candidatus Krumholzibacteriia bacterium]